MPGISDRPFRRNCREACLRLGYHLAAASWPLENVPMRARMHADQVETDSGLVMRLIAAQFPEWADLPIVPVESSGTDHDIYRIGDRLTVRLPIVGWAVGQAAKERVWLPKLAPQLPLHVPVHVATGHPTAGYPFEWSIYEWLPGEDANATLPDLNESAATLARFIGALRQIETGDAPKRPAGARGGPLTEHDGQVKHSIGLLAGRIDTQLATQRWSEAIRADTWDGPDVWIHGDLLPGNLLVVDGRISAIIDYSGLNVGDPAYDLLPAWNLLVGPSRDRFRSELGVDASTWLRGRGWALAQAVNALAYYWDTNPGMVRQATYALEEVLADAAG